MYWLRHIALYHAASDKNKETIKAKKYFNLLKAIT